MIAPKIAGLRKPLARVEMRLSRGLPQVATGAFLCCLLLSGCHKKSPPPPPPTYTAPTARRAPIVPEPGGHAPAASAKAHPPVVHAPIRPGDVEGRPVSTEIGLASWYGPATTNRTTADGAVFNPNELTAAHRTLPLGSIVRVTNLENGESVLVRITDRGPFVKGRALDLSLGAAKQIGVYKMGIAKVKIEAFAKPGADPEGHWCVQIGAFLDPADAASLKNDLLRRYSGAKVIEFASHEGEWVRISPIPATHEYASRIMDSIHIPDAEPFLVRLN
jgi:rare lipoprotein A